MQHYNVRGSMMPPVGYGGFFDDLLDIGKKAWNWVDENVADGNLPGGVPPQNQPTYPQLPPGSPPFNPYGNPYGQPNASGSISPATLILIGVAIFLVMRK